MDVRDGALGRGRGHGHMAEAGEEGKGSRSAVLSCYVGAGPSEKPLKGVTAAEGSSLPHLIPESVLENEHCELVLQAIHRSGRAYLSLSCVRAALRCPYAHFWDIANAFILTPGSVPGIFSFGN